MNERCRKIFNVSCSLSIAFQIDVLPLNRSSMNLSLERHCSRPIFNMSALHLSLLPPSNQSRVFTSSLCLYLNHTPPPGFPLQPEHPFLHLRFNHRPLLPLQLIASISVAHPLHLSHFTPSPPQPAYSLFSLRLRLSLLASTFTPAFTSDIPPPPQLSVP